jgi:hypothetical protein
LGIFHHLSDDSFGSAPTPSEPIDPGTEGCDDGDEVLHDVGFIILGLIDDLQSSIGKREKDGDVVGSDSGQSVFVFHDENVEIGVGEDLGKSSPVIVDAGTDFLDDSGDRITLGIAELSKPFDLRVEILLVLVAGDSGINAGSRERSWIGNDFFFHDHGSRRELFGIRDMSGLEPVPSGLIGYSILLGELAQSHESYVRSGKR